MSSDQENQQNANRSSLRLAPHTNVDETLKNKLPITRQFVNFTFYRATTEWRALNDEGKRGAKEDFLKAYEEFRRELLMHTYSLVGLRPNTDFMIWRIGYSLEPLQEMTTRLNQTRMARYLEVSQSFLSMTKRSMYIDKDNP
ncbi:MAG TPA: chlorite dismutase family protein, partial [Pyrinomonadaceae bacterium]|nr:chlorite dismutase family protein [Pyrinomonadaceae bacterium]